MKRITKLFTTSNKKKPNEDEKKNKELLQASVNTPLAVPSHGRSNTTNSNNSGSGDKQQQQQQQQREDGGGRSDKVEMNQKRLISAFNTDEITTPLFPVRSENSSPRAKESASSSVVDDGAMSFQQNPAEEEKNKVNNDDLPPNKQQTTTTTSSLKSALKSKFAKASSNVPSKIISFTKTTENVKNIFFSKKTSSSGGTGSGDGAGGDLSSLNGLDDFSLLQVFNRRLFNNTNSAVLAIRLIKQECEFLLVTQIPEFQVHGITTKEGVRDVVEFVIVWTLPLRSLLILREKHLTTVFQFQGGIEKKVLPNSKEERIALYYCVTRLAREFAGNDKVVDLSSSGDFVLNAPDVSLKCPILERKRTRRLSFHLTTAINATVLDAVEEDEAGAALLLDSQGERETVLTDSEEFSEKDERDSVVSDVVKEQAAAAAYAYVPPLSGMELETINRTVNVGEVLRLNKEEAVLVEFQAEMEALRSVLFNELQAWEKGVCKKIPHVEEFSAPDFGRSGDPIALLVHQLEEIHNDLSSLEGYYAKIENPITVMQQSIRDIELESNHLSEEIKVRQELWATTKQVLLLRLDGRHVEVIQQIPNVVGAIQSSFEEENQGGGGERREIEATGKELCRVLSVIAANEDALGDTKAMMELRSETFAYARDFSKPLVDLFQKRLNYYYCFESLDGEKRDGLSHAKLLNYATTIACVKQIAIVLRDYSLYGSMIQKYIHEAGSLLRRLVVYHEEKTTNIKKMLSKKDLHSLVFSNEATKPTAEREVESVRLVFYEPIFKRIKNVTSEEKSFCKDIGLFKEEEKEEEEDLLRRIIKPTIDYLSEVLSVNSYVIFFYSLPMLGILSNNRIKNKTVASYYYYENLLKLLQTNVDRLVYKEMLELMKDLKGWVKKIDYVLQKIASSFTTIHHAYFSFLVQKTFARISSINEVDARIELMFHLKKKMEWFMKEAKDKGPSSEFASAESKKENEALADQLDVYWKDCVLKFIQRLFSQTTMGDDSLLPFQRLFDFFSSGEEKKILDQILFLFSNKDDLARCVASIRAKIEKSFPSPDAGELKSEIFLEIKEHVLNAYWKLTEVSAENFGVIVMPLVEDFKKFFL